MKKEIHWKFIGFSFLVLALYFCIISSLDPTLGAIITQGIMVVFSTAVLFVILSSRLVRLVKNAARRKKIYNEGFE